MVQTFHELIAANRRKSSLLVVMFLLLFAATVFSIAVFFTGDVASGLLPAAVAVVAGGLMALFSYYQGAVAVLALSGAKEIGKEQDPELWNVIEELSIAGGVPMPRVYLIADTALNAFATGRDPEHAAVAITQGLRQRLNRAELQGVLAHELSHVRNYDIRFSMLLAVMVGLLVLVTDVFRRYLWWGGGRRSKRSEGGAAGGIIAVVAILLSIVAPLLARLIQLAASREREYLADASAVELTRYPEGLASALEKLGSDQEVLEVANRATQHLYIVNPFRPFEKRAKSALSTHPPLEDRIRRIRALGGSAPPEGSSS